MGKKGTANCDASEKNGRSDCRTKTEKKKKRKRSPRTGKEGPRKWDGAKTPRVVLPRKSKQHVSLGGAQDFTFTRSQVGKTKNKGSHLKDRDGCREMREKKAQRIWGRHGEIHGEKDGRWKNKGLIRRPYDQHHLKKPLKGPRSTEGLGPERVGGRGRDCGPTVYSRQVSR